MKKLLKILAVLVAVAFVAIQFWRPSFTNPPLVAGQSIEETMHVPSEVQMVLSRSCNDCHSNKTLYPWYSQVSPASWFMAGHISEGRAELNFSEWGTYSVEKKQRRLEEICEMVEKGAMPLPSYLWVHFDAELAPSQRVMICDWTRSEAARLGGA
jgi:hypothetical protein